VLSRLLGGRYDGSEERSRRLAARDRVPSAAVNSSSRSCRRVVGIRPLLPKIVSTYGWKVAAFFGKPLTTVRPAAAHSFFPPSYPPILGIAGTYILEIDASAVGKRILTIGRWDFVRKHLMRLRLPAKTATSVERTAAPVAQPRGSGGIS